MNEAIAVTGVGLSTCLGIGVPANWTALCEGRSGLSQVTRFETGDYPIQLAGQAPVPPPRRPEDAQLDFEARHLIEAISEALSGSDRREDGSLAGCRAGLVLGSSLAGSTSSDRFFESWSKRDIGNTEVGAASEGVDFGLLEGYYLEDRIDLLARRFAVDGPAVLVSNACAAGGSSLALAARWLRTRRVDRALALGFDPLSVFTFAGFGSLQALSRQGLRPFSADRDGMLLGDGFAAFALERVDSARAAGREILGLLSGTGESADAHHLTRPHPEGNGAALAMERALRSAGLDAADIGYVNCHGTATPANDSAEVSALESVFGERLGELPIGSSKPFFGHTLGGAGTVEAVVTLLSIREGLLTANLETETVDPAMPSLDLLREPRAVRISHAMSNSFGFGGSNTSIVLSHASVLDAGGDS